MKRVVLILSLVAVLAAGGVSSALAAASSSGPVAESAARARRRRARRRAARRARRRAARRRAAAGLPDGRYRWTAVNTTENVLVVSGRGRRVTLSYTFFRYGSSGGECVPTPITFRNIPLKPGFGRGTFRFESGDIRVGGVSEDGSNGGVASARGELFLSPRSFDVNLSIRLRNVNDKSSCFEFPSGGGKIPTAR